MFPPKLTARCARSRRAKIKVFHLLLVALLSPLVTSSAPAQEAQPYPSSAETFVIHSNILGEDRRLVIYNPDNVGGNVLPFYPVLYLLDENDMSMVAGMVKYLSAYNEQLPAMLVVGIDGGDRRMRDLTPTHSLYDNMGKLDPDPNGWLQPSGGGDKFLRFMREEVMPFVEKKYRTAPFRIFAGHSVGGLTVVHALTAYPDMFNAYLAVAPSLWWDKGGFVRSAVKHLPTGADKKFLFLADSPEGGPVPVYIKGFLGALATHKTQGFRWTHAYYPNETHGSIAAKAYYDGLRFLYPQWSAPEQGRTAASINRHYAIMSRRLGYEVQPPFDLVSDWASAFARKGMTADAIETARINVRNFPANAWAYAGLGDAYRAKGDKVAAIATYKKAIELAPDDKQSKDKLDALLPMPGRE
jgi:predicted alpha/beta superfamily hydrolase